MSTVYFVQRPSGKKLCYDFIRRLEKEEGFKKWFFDEVGLPYKQSGYIIEVVDHDSRL